MTTKPIIIAGPCMAESYETMVQVLEPMKKLSDELNFDYYFKASFDKANRTSIKSDRGPGLEKGMEWFTKIKETYGVKTLTDIHTPDQAAPAGAVCDMLQIPAFLARQTDLLVAALKTGKKINVKKGQFMSPDSMAHVVGKARTALNLSEIKDELYLTERGTFFGYGDLIVDVRAFAGMKEAGAPVLFDITHSTQRPAASGDGKTSGAQRKFAPLLARAAAASGYVDGFFLEVHPDPHKALSDKDAQLTVEQASLLLRQIIPLWQQSIQATELDQQFRD